MKKFTAMVLSMILCVSMLTGCGADYSADESTVFILKNGKIVTTDVDEFDTSKYDEDDFKSYINDTISEYTAENGSKSVKLKDLTIEEGKAYLTMEYASVEDYANFNGVEIFCGTIAEALAAGYAFDVDFASVSDGTIAEADTSAFMDDNDYNVVIIKSNVNVSVCKDIAFASVENTSYVDAKTIKIADGYNLLTGASEAATEEGTEAVTETYGTETDTTEASTEDLSVDSSDLLAEVTTEEESVEFDFGDDTEESEDSAYTNVYTYIIYK